MSVLEPMQPETPWDELIERSRRRGTVLRRQRLAARVAPAVVAAMAAVGIGAQLASVDPNPMQSHVTTVDGDRAPAPEPGNGDDDGDGDGTGRDGSGPAARSTAGDERDGGASRRTGGVDAPPPVTPAPETSAPTRPSEEPSAPAGPMRSGAAQKVAFVRGDPVTMIGSLFVMRPDGSGARRITEASGRPAWSPAGDRLAFHRSSQSGPSGQIYSVREDGTDERFLHTGMYVDWSPDGRTIAFSDGEKYDGVTFMDLWVADADGKNPRRVTDDPAGEYMATWSPDGGRLAYLRVEGTYASTGNASLWTVRVDGTDRRKLADIGAGALVNPAWSPDGTRLLFSCGQDLCIVDADGGRAATPFGPTGLAFEYGVAWAADGASIILQRDVDGPYVGEHMSLWSMDGSGGGLRRLTGDATATTDDIDPAVWPRYPATSG